MKFDHDVKHDGKWYPMGTDVPVGHATEAVAEPMPVAKEEPKAEVKPRGRKKKV